MMALNMLWLGLRILGPVYCAIKADHLNRSAGAWAVFGFIFPIIAIIWISVLPVKTIWTKE